MRRVAIGFTYAVSWLLATPWTPTTEAALELARQRKGYGAA